MLTHWVPDAPLVVETDASDYALGAILSIYMSDSEIHPVVFHSRTFSSMELNYDIHNKELLAIFEAFRVWRHYLEGSGNPIDMVTDHKNLEYFSTTKILTCRQARWSEYLSQFNLLIRFRPGRLGSKPDALTRCWNVYLREGGDDYATVNPQNFKPIFSNEQLTASIRATYLSGPVLRSSIIMDTEKLHKDIIDAYLSDPVTKAQLENLEPRWSPPKIIYFALTAASTSPTTEIFASTYSVSNMTIFLLDITARTRPSNSCAANIRGQSSENSFNTTAVK
ncbi:hypothetical protein CCMSSC00406_0002095 [Pleurotus cornucopiae]|uniref:Uncharacterized protein n=1 Tax=Pleurotus cornucopiae TaxID=5321 RepID=A0ACB7J4K7_PLECO|nr:hypothetical protein CCMSSC00406_0002095 [Pleurotus cornucopiae]